MPPSNQQDSRTRDTHQASFPSQHIWFYTSCPCLDLQSSQTYVLPPDAYDLGKEVRYVPKMTIISMTRKMEPMAKEKWPYRDMLGRVTEGGIILVGGFVKKGGSELSRKFGHVFSLSQDT